MIDESLSGRYIAQILNYRQQEYSVDIARLAQLNLITFEGEQVVQ